MILLDLATFLILLAQTTNCALQSGQFSMFSLDLDDVMDNLPVKGTAIGAWGCISWAVRVSSAAAVCYETATRTCIVATKLPQGKASTTEGWTCWSKKITNPTL